MTIFSNPAWTAVIDGAVATLAFERPPRNSLSFADVAELANELERVAGLPSVSVVVVCSHVDGYFIAHAEIEDLIGEHSSLTTLADGARQWRRALNLLETIPQPVLATVDGQAWGGGLEVALACTMRIATRRSHFAFPEVQGGIIPGGGGTQRLPRLIGRGRAADLILTGRRVGAEEALQLGLIDRVVDDGDLYAAASLLAQEIASNPRDAVAAAKRAIIAGSDLPIAEGLRLEGRLCAPLVSSESARSRLRSFQQAEEEEQAR